MISDGIMPSNEGRGYVLRRLLTSCLPPRKDSDIEGKFLSGLCETVIGGSKDGYPELEEKRDFILNVISKEEDQFNKTIDQGLGILAEMEGEMKEKGETVLSGDHAFKLYDTYGFPLDLTKEILEEKGISVDEEGFQKAMQVQRETARAARGVLQNVVADEDWYDEHAEIGLTEAQKLRKSYEIGDRVVTPLKTKDFGRIAAQTAKHVIRQGIREAERSQQLSEIQSRAHDIIQATVTRVDNEKGIVALDLGKGGEAILPRNEQVPGEVYTEGETLQAHVVDVVNYYYHSGLGKFRLP